MDYETAYRSQGLLPDADEKEFLTESDLEKIEAHIAKLRSTKAYNVLYFLRNSVSLDLGEDPIGGPIIYKFEKSSVRGPFNHRPKTSTVEIGGHRHSGTVVEKVFPAGKVPKSFEEVEATEYGIKDDDRDLWLTARELDVAKTKKIGYAVENKLKELATALHQNGSSFTALVDGCIIKFYSNKKKDGTYYDQFPHFSMKVFGPSGKPSHVVDKTGIRDLVNVVPSYNLDYFLQNTTEQGLAYGISFDRLGNLQKILDSEKVIL